MSDVNVVLLVLFHVNVVNVVNAVVNVITERVAHNAWTWKCYNRACRS